VPEIGSQKIAVYIITPEERCAFLYLNTDKEREQFIELFWYRRTVDSTSPDTTSKLNTTAVSVFANEKYGGPRAGWKTDRGRIYVLFGHLIPWIWSRVKEHPAQHPTKTQTLTSTLRSSGTTVTLEASGRMWNFTLSPWPVGRTMHSRSGPKFARTG